ncbi:MAG: histidine phosphatase family protein [Pseudomonadota bacterium]
MIYLIRHGEAAASWGEHPDPGLSETGQTQAQSVAEHLAAYPIKSIISSPMARCRETAAYFGQQSGLDVTVDTDVTEIPTPADISDRVPWLRSLMSGNWAETPMIVANWRDSLLAKIATLPDETAVFSHFVAINAIVGRLEGVDTVTVFRPNYCSVTNIERRDEQIRLHARGDSLDTRIL